MSQIEVRGAKQHNLKNISVNIPKDELVVITGVSGSGKSSLAFDTVFAEGQRRYVESLSAYARQFLGQLDKPDVEEIKGLSPAIAIDQKSTSHNPRSTVGTVTEIYDHLRLLYARIGTPHCHVCGAKIQSQSIDQIMDQVMSLAEETKIIILAPLVRAKKGEHQNLFSALKAEGFIRVRVNGTIFTLEEEIKMAKTHKHDIDLVIDRVVIKASARSRIADSISLALKKGEGIVMVHELVQESHGAGTRKAGLDQGIYERGTGVNSSVNEDAERINNADISQPCVSRDHLFSELLACPNGHGSMQELDPKLFSFNTPHGACEHCSGLGVEQEFAPDLIIPNPNLSLAEGAILPWAKTNNVYYKALLEGLAKAFKFDINSPFKDLPESIQDVVLHGSEAQRISIDTDKYPSLGYDEYRTYYEGVVNQLQRRYFESSSDKWKGELEQYMIETPCPKCHGARLRPEAIAVDIAGQSIYDACSMSIERACEFFNTLDNFLNTKQQKIAHQLLIEIRLRLKFLMDVGLNYLTLTRSAKTLSGGEAQRIRLASQIGSGLSGVLYVLDEPSIGLHQRDNNRLLHTLENLKNLGNTVLVVEHDEDTMKKADWIIDIGRGAGVHGGYVVAEGTLEDIKACNNSITGDYLSGRKQIKVPLLRREGNSKFLTLSNAHKNNLKNLDLKIPLGKFIAVTGVSGSGKSSLINELLYPALQYHLTNGASFPKELGALDGYQELDKIIVIDQSPIGRTPRSNPATYTGVFDPVREIFAQTIEAKARGYQAGRFSFNVKGGRCESCGGAGLIEIEMNFLPSVFVKCDVCKGRRYNQETLEVKFKGKSIYDVLEMTIEEALEFFDAIPKAKNKLQTLHDVGLDYVRLGQAATTLSGGEAQRIKLASELSKRSTGKTIYLLDEPTTGLHWRDIQLLLNVLNRLVDSGNTILVIEHNLDVIKQADHIIDLGPEGGEHGGQVIVEGSPEAVAASEISHTGRYLRPILESTMLKIPQ
jgi:excinuclease ABC subunit A